MQRVKEEIQTMYNYLTGNQFTDWELNQMSNRELRDLHSELSVSHREAIEDTIAMYIDLNY